MVVRIYLESFASRLYAYISGKDRVLISDTVASQEVIDRMKGRDVAYFTAQVDKNGTIHIGKEVTGQEW